METLRIILFAFILSIIITLFIKLFCDALEGKFDKKKKK
jgi:hypothetical protein